MRTLRILLVISCFSTLAVWTTQTSEAQQTSASSAAATVSSVEIKPATSEISVGQKVKFTAVAKDAAGNVVAATPSTWFAAPFDLAGADESGTISFFSPGEVLVGAIVGGKTAFVTVKVKAGQVTRIDIEPVGTPLVVGATTQLAAVARSSEGNPRNDARIDWTSNAPQIATVDAAGTSDGNCAGPGKNKCSFWKRRRLRNGNGGKQQLDGSFN